ncbi:para-nitrophenol 4-monooxygenase [Zopfia rhizophila CBS 207.26]|uniref:Para-nitrophenol 4-monooxygenase n=1 Tax=Zopfia rhizophila CBS 207.26 TaxID=1314779 RepID=A0A6A6DLC5_9PEZI|nr:para-nitrophenol 4-monooxygenase [Zopfia rhizophila CBS 207.26]
MATNKSFEGEEWPVIIIGAGPAGLFLALKIAKKGVRVLVLEKEKYIVPSPRANIYMPIVLNEFEKVGIFEPFTKVGFQSPEGPTWRTPYTKGNKVLAKMNYSLIPKGSALKYKFAGMHLGQHQLAALFLEHAQKLPNFNNKWNHCFTSVEQDSDGATVHVSTPEGAKAFRAKYVIACDGASSAVRQSLSIPFDGTTWTNFRFMATNVKYDFTVNGLGIANTVVDDEDWAIIVRLDRDPNFWRVAYGIKDGMDLSTEECLKTIPEKFERLFPGERPLKYEVVNANPYVAHQRCAGKFREGRVILCSDAAHCNSPIGGLGLTTGLLDCAALGNCLIRILVRNEADPDALLDRYAKVRRGAWLGYTNPQSTENTLRMLSNDPEVAARRNKFFDKLNTDPGFHIQLAEAMNEVLIDSFETDGT